MGSQTNRKTRESGRRANICPFRLEAILENVFASNDLVLKLYIAWHESGEEKEDY